MKGDVRRPHLKTLEVSLHAKAIVVDRKSIFIGSMNLDPRSRLTNTEVALLIDSAVLGSELVQWFDEATLLDRSFKPDLVAAGNPNAPLVWIGRKDDRQRYASEPHSSWWRRFVSGVLGATVPEELL